MTSKVLRALFSMLALAGCAQGYAGQTSDRIMLPPPGEPLIIAYAAGGIIQSTEWTFALLEQRGSKVEIRGWCISACVLALNYKNVCYSKTATFYLHQASHKDGSRSPAASDKMRAALPPKARLWADKRGAFSRPGLTKLSGSELAAMDDQQRICKP